MVPAHMQKIPPLAMECVMTGIQPSHEMNAHALWSQEAINQFSRITNQGNLYGKVSIIIYRILYKLILIINIICCYLLGLFRSR